MIQSYLLLENENASNLIRERQIAITTINGKFELIYKDENQKIHVLTDEKTRVEAIRDLCASGLKMGGGI